MKKYLLSASIVALVATAGCTTLTAPEETKALQASTESFTAALRSAENATNEAISARDLENIRSRVANGEEMTFETGCVAGASLWKDDLTTAATSAPGDWRALDAIYARRVSLAACDVAHHDVAPPPARPLPDSMADPAHVLNLDAADLSTAAAHLNAYVEALADIATGESSAAVDAAFDKAVTAAQGFANTLDSSNTIAGPLLALGGRAVRSIIAARRNETTRRFLDRMDRVMPGLMERLGLAARLAVADAMVDRARAAEQVARYGKRVLNPTRRPRRLSNPAATARLAQFDQILVRLDTHNAAFRELRRSDPMIAARAFANSHRALTRVFSDPDHSRRAFAGVLQEFVESARDLAEALHKAAED